MNHITAYIMPFLGSLSFIIWSFLYFKYEKKFRSFTKEINSEEYVFPQLYFIGFGCIDLLNFDFNTSTQRALYHDLLEIKGEKTAQFHQYVVVGGQFTYIFTLIPIGLFLGSFTNEVLISILGLITGIGLAYYLQYEIKIKIKTRRNSLNSSFAEVLSKITLLMNAGQVLRDAWVKVANSNENILYLEMRTTGEEMRNGLSDQEAISNFAKRCATKEIRKFSSIVIQNLHKGSADLTNSLKLLTMENWELKRHEVKRKSELAGQKLLIPIGIMFAGILLMIMVPIFTNMF
ncbi:MAG: secretion protein [Bacillales bacterium]|nr:secretion protein [Bacillales bacterium]